MSTSDPLRAAASLLVPPRCAICTAECDWSDLACERCASSLLDPRPVRRAVPGLDLVTGAGAYEGVTRKLVAALKFGPRPALAPLAARAIAAALESPRGDATVVPAPPAPRRAARRGFDPAEMIAAALARELGLPLAHPLARASGPRQVGRTRGERLAAPPRVRCAEPAPRRALLVDDVLTTGATLAACARALREGGALEVAAVVLAVAPPGRRRPFGAGAGNA